MTRSAYALLFVTLLFVSILPASGQSKKSSSSSKSHKQQKYPIGGSYPSGANLKVAKDLPQRLAKWKTVPMPFRQQGLSSKEVKLVDKLVEAARYLDYIYWRQSDPEGLTLYEQLKGSRNPRDQQILKMLYINGGRFDLIDENKPFIGTEPMPPGHGLYPHGLTREEIEKYVAAHPEKKPEIYNQFTVVRRRRNDLEGLPYHVAYRAFLDPAAKALREAAALSDDKSFADFLRLRADALMTDDYYKSDIAWVDLKDPKFDIIFAPYETYLDDLLGVKGSYGGAVLIRNAAESKKLAAFEQYVPDIQEALPLAPEDKPSKKGQPTPMEVMDAPYRTGDLLHGYQAVADNLPNDPRIHQEKGTKKIFFKNFMDARVNYVVLPVARKIMRADQASLASAEGYLTDVMMHEISHGIGPAYSRTKDGQQEINAAIGPVYSALEEAKADITGMFGVKWLVEKGVLPKERLNEFYASYVAGIFRSVRFGIGEAHGRAEMMEFNYLAEKAAIRTVHSQGVSKRGKGATSPTPAVRYEIVYDKMPDAVAALTRELLEIEATGDRTRAEQWFARYDKMPDELRKALAAASDVPVDVFPDFSFPQTVQ
jgi:Peptidase family M49